MPTRTRSPLHRIPRTAAALFLTAALGVTGTVVASAAEGGELPDGIASAATPAASTGRVVEFPMSPLWTNDYSTYGDNYYRPAASIFIGPDTRTLLLDVDIAAQGPVTCIRKTSYSQLPPLIWTAEEWESDDPKTAPITEAYIEEDGDEHILQCNSGSIGGPGSWQLKWWLTVQRTDQGPVVVLDRNERLLSSSFVEQVYTTPRDARPVSPGDTVRLAGVPGTWPQGPDPYLAEPVITLFSGGSDTDSVSVDGSVVSADGSTLDFIVPTAPTPDFFTENATFSVKKSQYTDPEGWSTENHLNSVRTTFTSPLAYTDETVAATVAVYLDARYALSFQRRIATAVVTTTGGSGPAGTVSFAANGRPVGATILTAADNGTVSFRLPALARGRYSITATFTPDTGAPTTSTPGAWLRVLR